MQLQVWGALAALLLDAGQPAAALHELDSALEALVRRPAGVAAGAQGSCRGALAGLGSSRALAGMRGVVQAQAGCPHCAPAPSSPLGLSRPGLCPPGPADCRSAC
ncbi:hypothetical protein V8C86DRAFT_940955 [Haematococcus lacustris]